MFRKLIGAFVLCVLVTATAHARPPRDETPLRHLQLAASGRVQTGGGSDATAPERAPAAPPQPANPVGTLSPDRGPWGAMVRVKGARFGSAEGVRAMWYANDDLAKPPAMSQSATIYRRHGADEIEAVHQLVFALMTPTNRSEAS